MQLSGVRLDLLFATAIVAVLVVFLIEVPRHYRFLPEFSEVVIGAVLIVFLWTPGARYAVAVFFLIVASTERAVILVRLLYEMAIQPANLVPVTLLWTAIDLWLTNAVVFALVYWPLDRGGPIGRAGAWRGRADFDFPRGDAGTGVPLDWQPSLIDYLYLAFTTSLAFSPSEIFPLTARAKILHLMQSLISLLTVVALAARAINGLDR